ncbi:glycine betaine/proline transport system substrate-binding protein [Halobacillus karajensis]|uniref:Glycine betaine/carnitine transport binding protein GbuC n=1 Tax=Halobacillus karajensis TaxID=195088 RepID=A0A059NY31_9BACI|nr:glycine betaine ABC transporter substrate-binding protein [Halobacillus karajensis]CDQ21108.1 Glycine betaine/carnitine transport binding protein GbuC precursor [Halobacillus karajensis]CDQ24828.1 Glycine betaine/carnitine transport binding protein GbuC precursor [Halobacillus karajensis]CDQ28812.1 Glycine betaine/carnitine transport binding protein GbuC precursor [Halobacillus karajensis]SEH96125.1 glycine betaine/proline transport system substrate-binding protein [Halobacillus karajensis]
MFNWKRFGMVAGLSLTLVAAGCGSSEDEGSETTGNNSEDGATSEINYGEEMGYEITGIEAGAGVVGSAETATEEYENLRGWEVSTSSSGAMATALGEAIENEEPIVVTGWTPHWKFAKYDLKYLDDPKEVFGGEEEIKTMVRQGLEDEKPNAYKILDQFNWEASDMEEVMLEISNGTSPEEAAQNWIENNQDKVDSWTEGTEEVDDTEVELVYVNWDSEIASTNVIAEVMKEQGFDVTITPLDNGPMWESVATGEVTGMVAAWLPVTHGDLYEQHKDHVEDLGANLEGAKIGLVVPEYMDIDSIEDLEAAE